MKGLKIFNGILFFLICTLECVALYYLGVSIVMFFSGNVAEMLVTMLMFLPMFIIVLIAMAVITIILTITTKIKIKKASEVNQVKTKFDSLCLALPWVFIVCDAILFFGFLIYCNASKT